MRWFEELAAILPVILFVVVLVGGVILFFQHCVTL